MRRFDKKYNMQKANLLAESRYLESKGLLSEAILPLKGGKFAFAEDNDEQLVDNELPRYEHGETISCELETLSDVNEGIKNIITGAFIVCSLGACKKLDNKFMYKFVYDTRQSLENAQKDGVERRITCLVPSNVILKDNPDEYNNILNQLRNKYKNANVKIFGDTIVPMDDKTPQSPYMDKINGKIVINTDKLNANK